MGFARSIVKRLLPSRWRSNIRERIVSMKVSHLHGPRRIRLSQNEAVVTCIVKNGEFYIEPFISHYSQMGFRHIFFLDNGSSDQTISLAKKHSNVSICRSDLPIDINQGLFKKYMAQKSTEGGWCLDADIDEFFDYPYSDVIGLVEFLEYLNKKRYTAVITQLLDMFSDKPASHLAKIQEENLKAVYQYYDISEVKKTEYHRSEFVRKYGEGNECSNSDTALLFGGIRKTLYGNDCLLTKHSLFCPEKGLELFPHVHFVNKARLSDVSCVMLHYKLTSNALDVALQNQEGFSANRNGYASFVDFLKNKPNYEIKRNTAVKFSSVNELVENGFLFVSDEYRDHVSVLAKGRASVD